MTEIDIRQHIISASRGNFNDLYSALTDFQERISSQEGVTSESAATLARINTPIALTDAATVSVDMSVANIFVLSFLGSRTIANPTGHVVGMYGEFWLYNFNGGNELTWESHYDFVGTPTTAQGIGALSCVRYRVVGPTSVLCTMQNS